MEMPAAFSIRNKQVMTFTSEKAWTSVGPCQFYHSRLVTLPGQNSCLVVGGSVDIDMTNPTDKVFAFTKDGAVERKAMSVMRSKVGLCTAEARSETNAFYSKSFVFAFGGIGKDKKALKSVEQFTVKANVWKSLADLNVARSCASGTILGDYLYVFGGAECETSIERFNLKASMTKIVEKFETIDIKLPIGASDIGILPLPSSSELLLIGGYGG
jgi:N-acetylneuraminic acid mutarotase